jgi:hypothetical protein
MTIVEYTEQEHNIRNGIDRGSSASTSSATARPVTTEADSTATTAVSEGGTKSVKSNKKATGDVKEKDQMYYSVTCKDNGCGIPEKNIGDMLGRVLSGSKHGLRQTRGKFGLGAKMVCSVNLES